MGMGHERGLVIDDKLVFRLVMGMELGRMRRNSRLGFRLSFGDGYIYGRVFFCW